MDDIALISATDVLAEGEILNQYLRKALKPQEKNNPKATRKKKSLNADENQAAKDEDSVPCTICGDELQEQLHDAVGCDECGGWTHAECENISKVELLELEEDKNVQFTCLLCKAFADPQSPEKAKPHNPNQKPTPLTNHVMIQPQPQPQPQPLIISKIKRDEHLTEKPPDENTTKEVTTEATAPCPIPRPRKSIRTES